MFARLPRTLWRYLATDVGRLLLVSTVAIVVVISFAAAVKPLADGKVGLVDAFKLMGLFAIPMLQFALPFAGGFAATRAYHRFASQNEAMAAMAGGVPHRALLAPAALWGLVLAVVIAALTNLVIPHFLRSAERIVRRDVGRVIVAPLERGEPLRVGKWDLRADEVHRLDVDQLPEAFGRIVLQGVIAAHADRQTGVRYYASAERIDMFLMDDDQTDGTRIDLVFTGATGVVPSASDVESRRVSFDRFRDSISVPTSFDDDPKFLTLGEMLRVRAEPRRMNRIDRLARRVGVALAQSRAIDDVRARVRFGDRLVFDGPRGERIDVRVGTMLADGEEGWTLLPLEGAEVIEVEHVPSSGILRRHLARGAVLRLVDPSAPTGDFTALLETRATDAPPEEPVRFVLELREVRTRDDAGGAGDAERSRVPYSGLTLPGAETDLELLTWPVPRLVASAEALADADPELGAPAGKLAQRLVEETRKQDREIVAKLHERAAFIVAALLMVVLGAIIAMRMRDSMPLPVYLWSFLPALGTVIAISTGVEMAYKTGPIGLALVWAGVGGLAVATLVQYAALRRR